MHSLLSVFLAESKTTAGEVIGWSVAMLVLLVIGMAWAARLKRKVRAEDQAPAPAMGFTLSDLRQMHREGQITDAEFAKAKEKVVDAAKKAAEKPPAPDGTVERDSADAIRARRLAREAQEQQQQDPEVEDQ